jgi:hypothetical protein
MPFAELLDGFRLNLVTVTFAEVSGTSFAIRIGCFGGIGWVSADWIDLAEVGACGQLL